MEKISLSFSSQELAILQAALGQMPYSQVFTLIESIKDQLRAQSNRAEQQQPPQD